MATDKTGFGNDKSYNSEWTQHGSCCNNNWRRVEWGCVPQAMPEVVEQVESPSAWTYLADQENGDQVDCWSCGNALNDDLPILNLEDGHAVHEGCEVAVA